MSTVTESWAGGGAGGVQVDPPLSEAFPASLDEPLDEPDELLPDDPDDIPPVEPEEPPPERPPLDEAAPELVPPETEASLLFPLDPASGVPAAPLPLPA